MSLLFMSCLQILVQHIRTVLPGLKARISAQLVAVAKEHATYGDITESKVSYPLKWYFENDSDKKIWTWTIAVLCYFD